MQYFSKYIYNSKNMYYYCIIRIIKQIKEIAFSFNSIFKKIYKKRDMIMRKQLLNMRALISANKKEILGNKKEIARIEKQIDDKHVRKLQALRKRDNNSLAID